jgi:hypothetical protein
MTSTTIHFGNIPLPQDPRLTDADTTQQKPQKPVPSHSQGQKQPQPSAALNRGRVWRSFLKSSVPENKSGAKASDAKAPGAKLQKKNRPTAPLGQPSQALRSGHAAIQEAHAIAEKIDLLQGTVHSLCDELSAHTSTRREKKIKNKINAALRKLEKLHDHCASKHMRQGVTAGSVRWYVLARRSSNALADVRSVIAQTQNDSLTWTSPLAALPEYIHRLDEQESESFALNLAKVRSLLDLPALRMTEENIHTLLEAASQLMKINNRHKHLLDAQAQQAGGNNPAQFRERYESIDRFETALQTAINDAIYPSSATDSITAIGSLLKKEARLSEGEWKVVDEHYEKLGQLVKQNCGPQANGNADDSPPDWVKDLEKKTDSELRSSTSWLLELMTMTARMASIAEEPAKHWNYLHTFWSDLAFHISTRRQHEDTQR